MEQKKLAELWVEFKAKGDKLLEQSLDDTKTKLEDTDKKTVGFKKTMEGLQNTFRLVRIAAVASIGQIVNQVTSLARAGLNLSMEGQYLQTQFQYLSREVANLFVPVIRVATNAIRDLIDWFRSLDGGQQRAIGNIVAFGSAFIAATGAIIGLVTAGGLIAATFGSLGAAILPIAGVIGMIGVASQSGNNAIRALYESFNAFYQAITPLIDSIVFLFEQISGAIGDVFQSMAQDTLGALPGLREFASMMGSIIRQLAPVLADIMSSLFGGFRTFYTAVLQVFNQLRPQFGQIQDIFSRLVNLANRFWTALRPLVDELFNDAAEAFASTLYRAMRILITGLEMAVTLMEQIANNGNTIGSSIFGQLGSLLSGTEWGGQGQSFMASGPTQFPTWESFSNPNQPQNQLTPRGGGFEDVRAAFRRFQEEAVRAGGGPEQQTADATQQAAVTLSDILNYLQQNGPMLFQAFNTPQPVNGGPA